MTSVEQEPTEASFRDVIRVNEAQVRSHVDQVVRATVEETLNSLLDAEADQLCGAKRYERSPERLDTRSGHYARKLLTKAGEVQLQVPRCGRCPSRPKSSSVTGGAKAASRKPWSRCTWPA